MHPSLQRARHPQILLRRFMWPSRGAIQNPDIVMTDVPTSNPPRAIGHCKMPFSDWHWAIPSSSSSSKVEFRVVVLDQGRAILCARLGSEHSHASINHSGDAFLGSVTHGAIFLAKVITSQVEGQGARSFQFEIDWIRLHPSTMDLGFLDAMSRSST
jgi:hypothetical protein